MFFISLSAPCQHPASLALRQQLTVGGMAVGWERPARVGGGIILIVLSTSHPGLPHRLVSPMWPFFIVWGVFLQK